MKKFIVILIALFSFSLLSNAQVRPDVPQRPAKDNSTDIEVYQNLLLKQNTILSNRKTALTVSLIGGGLATAGSALYSFQKESGDNPYGGLLLSALGGVTGLVGGVWMIVNEYNLVENQKRINHTNLRLTQKGVAIVF